MESTFDTAQVAVVCVTYNHEKYVAQALDSFLAQETTFPVEILVVDDCSTDGTWDILQRYAQDHPELIPVQPSARQGAERNLVAACQSARAPYIALCDGDDYWTDPRKLQEQYELMEAHPEYRACFHDTEIMVESDAPWIFEKDYQGCPDGKMRWWSGHPSFVKKDAYTIEDYIPYGFVHSSSMFFRWGRELEIPEWFYHHLLGDYTLWCLQVGLGQFGYLDKTMSVYRRWGGSGYEFASRPEFWRATRRDWARIDADLYAHFKKLGAPKSLLSRLAARRRSDYGKWVVGSALCAARLADRVRS